MRACSRFNTRRAPIAQGPARPAFDIRRPTAAHPRAAADHRRRRRRGRAAARPGRWGYGRDRRAGPGRRCRAVAATARGGRAVRPFTWRRELRNGADRGVCSRYPGRRVGHRGLPPGRYARPRRPADDPGRPAELAEVLRSLWLDPVRREQIHRAALVRADDFAWPQVARRVVSVYERAVAAPVPVGAAQTARVKAGLVQRDLTPSPRARRLPSIEPTPPEGAARIARPCGTASHRARVVGDHRSAAGVLRAAPRRFRQRGDHACTRARSGS